MVLSSLRSQRSGLYILQAAFELPEPLDIGRFQAAWRKVAGNHSALRTSFLVGGEEVQSVLNANPDVPWENSALPLASFFKIDRERGFDFRQGIPMRFTMLDNTLVWTGHHALLDGRSYAVLWSEVFACYENPDFVLPATHPLAEMESPDLDATERYWRECLAGIAATTDYIEERIRPDAIESFGEPSDVFLEENFALTDRETESLNTFAKLENLTMNTLVLGAWAQLLSRYSQRQDIVFGATRALRRSRDGVRQEGVGLFINTVPIRIHVSPGYDSLRQIRQQWVAGREHASAALERIQEWSGLPPGAPLFDSVVVYDHQSLTDSVRSLGGLARFCTTGGVRRTGSPISVIVFGGPRLRVDIVYDANRFSRQTMAGVSAHFRNLLTSFGQRMLAPAEQDWLIYACNEQGCKAGDTQLPAGLRAHQLFEQQVVRTPDKIAIEFDGGSLTYRELNERADRVAALLPFGNLVAVCLPRSPEAAIALLGVLKAGAAFLPIDPALPASRIASILDDARPDLLFRSAETVERLDNTLSGLSRDTAYVVYTSGTTGAPKGFAVTHRSLVNHTLAATAVFGIVAEDRRLQFAPVGTDVFIAEVFNYLSRGATLVMCPGQRSVSEFTRLLEERRISVTAFTGTWWTEWVAALSSGSFQIPDSLRAVIVGMEQVNADAFQTWKRLVGSRVRWFNAYGPGETCPTATIYEAGSSAYECGAYVPIGRPLANTRAYVLDADMFPVPIGVAGELYIGGEGVSSGYLNRPELNAKKFLPDPFRPGTRIYRTGDMVFRLPDGFLVFVGRTDRQVKIRGFRIELEEIEAVLARHPAVRQCAVVAQGGEMLVAYVSFHRGKEENLQGHMARRLPAHMIPAAFVRLAELPITAGGKIDLQSLPPYRPPQSLDAQAMAPTSSDTAKRLSTLWAAILGTSEGNFFESGGDSLRATRLLVLIQREFGKELPMSVIFRAPTIPALASFLESGAPAKTPRRNIGSRVPVFFISAAPDDAHRFSGLAEGLDEDQPFFALPSPLGPGEPPKTLEQIAQLVCRSVRKEKANGPYILGGFCFGGLVAIEVARQLRRDGEDVRLVVLFDTPAPGYPKALRSGRNYLRELRKGVEVSEAVRHVAHLGRLLQKKIAPPITDPRALAAAQYSLNAIEAPVAQFIAAKDAASTRILNDPRLGWRDFCRAGFEVRYFPSNHLSLFLEELPPDLMGGLRELLRTAESRPI